MNETDKQVAALLEKLQEVAPEVVEQAVAFEVAFASFWLYVLVPVALVCVVALFGGIGRCMRFGWDDLAGPLVTIVSTIVLVVSFVAIGANGYIVAKATIAPDYYGAELVADMVKK